MSILDDEHPKVRLHPPLLMVTVIVAGFCLRAFLGGTIPLPRLLGEGLGTICILAAITILQIAITTFAEGGEQLRPTTGSRQLFTKGVYAYSRNPIYVAMVLLGVGLGLATLNFWTVLLTILAAFVLHFFVIMPEERYLDDRFGDDYEAYKKSVRRWV